MRFESCAILLAGGRASRMGGIDKPGLLVDGASMRDRAISAVRDAGASPIIVVGPEVAADADVRWTREDPPFAGPAAAVISGLRALDDDPEWVFVLACDLAHPDAAVRLLHDGIRDLPSVADGLCLTDTGHPQWLTGIYRTRAVRREAAAAGDGRDLPVRALLTGIAPVLLPADADSARDVDTWEDYEEFTKEHP